jgi:single-stranded-DNA-specific exonuclease
VIVSVQKPFNPLESAAAPVRVEANASHRVSVHTTQNPGMALMPTRGLTRRWVYRAGIDAATPMEQTPDALARRLLHARGMHDSGELDRFLNPRLTHLHDPSLIPGMHPAARRLLDALRAREPIVIYGDYDVDGITSTAILYHLFKHLQPDAPVSTYVPHRLDEGYGLNTHAVEELAARGAKVIVTVDCGVTAVAQAKRARELSVDLIITDHHNPPATMDELPEAFAVVHPRRPDSSYPFGELCGAGVAYKLAWAMSVLDSSSGRAGESTRALLIDSLAFAALGSIADVVPLIGENRVITRFGLERIRSTKNIGLRALIDAAGLGGSKVDSFDVGFKLAPRLNASGRMAHAEQAVELFTTADAARATEIAEFLEAQNRQRRAVEDQILREAIELANAQGMTRDDRRAIVLASENWHAGVVGIVCSRLVERFGRPAILLHTHDGISHGSGRSIEGFNLHGALQACAEHLTKFGGHDMAAGLSLDPAKVSAFVESFIAFATSQIPPENLTRELHIDCTAQPHELTPMSVAQLDRLAPFGRGNPSPTLLLRNLVLAAPPTPLGKTGEHLALTVRDASTTPPRASGGLSAPSKLYRVVAWRWGEHRAKLVTSSRFDAVVKPSISTFSGSPTVEPELIDLAFC